MSVISLCCILVHPLVSSCTNLTYNCSSGEDNGQAESWDDNARCEEDGQLFAGITGWVCVIHDSPRDAVRDRRKDVEEEEEQRPVFTAKNGRHIVTQLFCFLFLPARSVRVNLAVHCNLYLVLWTWTNCVTFMYVMIRYLLIHREGTSEHEKHEANGPSERKADESCSTRAGEWVSLPIRLTAKCIY